FFVISMLLTSVFAVTTSTSEVPQDPAAPSGRPKIALRGAKVGTTPGPPLPSQASEASEEISPRTKDEGGPALTIVLIVFIVVGAALTALMLAKVCAHRRRSDSELPLVMTDQEYERYEMEMELMRRPRQSIEVPREEKPKEVWRGGGLNLEELPWG
ncbi:unnamed protein product, partial [Cladocopium goreaui]